MQINKEILERLRTDPKLRAKITLATGKADFTLLRWVKLNSQMLTLPSVTDVICKETGLPLSAILDIKTKQTA